MSERIQNTNLGFLLGFLSVTTILVITSFWVITFVYRQTQDDEEIDVDEALSAIYIDYYNSADSYVSAESYLAMGDYASENELPQNVQVLDGLTTNAITGYMLNHFSAGLGVDCTHCHTLDDFAADVWDDEVAMANKMTARAHLEMTGDLNINWMSILPEYTADKQPSGAQITCATCHNGVPQPVTWEEEGPAVTPLRLPLDDVFSVEEIGILNVNARDDISLDTVQYNQRIMYHMNTSLGVGCTHCHNSRYFPSYEVPAKHFSIHMLQMSQHIWDEYSDILGGQEPSCNMCHQGAAIPPGAARSSDVLPAPIVSQ